MKSKHVLPRGTRRRLSGCPSWGPRGRVAAGYLGLLVVVVVVVASLIELGCSPDTVVAAVTAVVTVVVEAGRRVRPAARVVARGGIGGVGGCGPGVVGSGAAA